MDETSVRTEDYYFFYFFFLIQPGNEKAYFKNVRKQIKKNQEKMSTYINIIVTITLRLVDGLLLKQRKLKKKHEENMK